MNNQVIFATQHWETLIRWYPYQFRFLMPLLGHGWRGIFAEACQQIHLSLTADEQEHFHWNAISEHNGRLLLSYSTPIDKDGTIADIISSLEVMSTLVCEISGKHVPCHAHRLKQGNH